MILVETNNTGSSPEQADTQKLFNNFWHRNVCLIDGATPGYSLSLDRKQDMTDWTIAGHRCSNHARRRLQQRGIKKETVEFILLHGDRREYVGDDTASIYLSKRKIRQLFEARDTTLSIIERAAKVIVLTSEEIIVTAMPRISGRPRRHQRGVF